jgi:NAD(P)-dependent dehydrogenase (short-subunit alcohol dehydrogenase family)
MQMQEQGKGSIINTASFVAVMGAATSLISYSASKGGVLAMSREPASNSVAKESESTPSARGRSTPGC